MAERCVCSRPTARCTLTPGTPLPHPRNRSTSGGACAQNRPHMAGPAEAASPAMSTSSTYRATFAIIGIYAALTLALLTVGRQPGPELPGFNAAFGAGVLVADLATGFLLLVLFRQTLSVSVLLLAGAFLFSAAMAVAYGLAFPGALTAGRALVGSGQTISWVYN